MDNIESYIVCSIVVLGVLIYAGKYIYEWYSDLKYRNRMFDAILKTQLEIARKLGVDENDLTDITNAAYKENKPTNRH